MEKENQIKVNKEVVNLVKGKEAGKEVAETKESPKPLTKPAEHLTKKEQPIAQEKKPRKDEAIVKCSNLPISFKKSMAICKAIKYRSPQDAIKLLENVKEKKTAIAIKKGAPHKKGMAGGIYPVKAAGYFIKALKNVIANAEILGMNTNNLAVWGIANKGSKAPKGGPKGMYTKFKRTNLIIKAKERGKKQ